MDRTAGSITLFGTSEQPNASTAPLSGGTLSITGGFGVVAAQSLACPCVADFDLSGGTPDAGDIVVFFAEWLADGR
jgi:hypothetical protein